MKKVLSFIGKLTLFFALLINLFLFVFFLLPTSKLLPMAYSGASLIEAEEIPQAVEVFLSKYALSLSRVQQTKDELLANFTSNILELRREKFMNQQEELAFDLSLLHFNNQMTGLKQAAEYYYQKPLTTLSDAQWVSLVNLHDSKM